LSDKVIRSEEARFVWDPAERQWLTPWQATRRLNMPGLPRRWRQIADAGHEDRTYLLTTQEAGGLARWVKFRVSPGGWETVEHGDVMWARNGLELHQYGARLEGLNPRRRKPPERTVEKGLIWRVHEIGLEDALVSLPEAPGNTFAVSKRSIRFAEAEPTPLECRLQQLHLLTAPKDLPNNHPLKWSHWLLEAGRRERPLLGYDGAQVYIRRPFEEWERLRLDNGLTVDEALVAIHAGLARMPDDGPDGHSFFASRDNVDRWKIGYWGESDAEVMQAVAGLSYLETQLVRAAMLAVDQFKEFMVHGGSFVLPAPTSQSRRPGHR